MDISSFDDLLHAARLQTQPQRLLLVFAGATLPDHASPEQRAHFEAGESGELAPLMCVAKDPLALASFEALIDEAADAMSAGPAWALVFAAALSGRDGLPPSDAQVDTALQTSVEAVRSGDVARLIPFDRQGHAVKLG